MLPLSINEVTTYRWSFDEDVIHYARAGIRAMGVWRPKLADFGEDKGLELLADSQLAVSNLLWAGGFTGGDGRSFRDSLADAAEAIRLAAQLQARALVVYSGSRSGHTLNHARRLALDALSRLAPLAEEHGVDLALEPMHRNCAAEWTYLTGIDDALELIDAVGSPRLKLAFDTYHLGHDEAHLSRLDELAERIAVVHLGDARGLPAAEQDRCPLGEGLLPLGEIIERLTAAGYDGYFDVELIGEEITPDRYADLIEHARGFFAHWSSVDVA